MKTKRKVVNRSTILGIISGLELTYASHPGSLKMQLLVDMGNKLINTTKLGVGHDLEIEITFREIEWEHESEKKNGKTVSNVGTQEEG